MEREVGDVLEENGREREEPSKKEWEMIPKGVAKLHDQ